MMDFSMAKKKKKKFPQKNFVLVTLSLFENNKFQLKTPETPQPRMK